MKNPFMNWERALGELTRRAKALGKAIRMSKTTEGRKDDDV